jgi:hypothetical protein
MRARRRPLAAGATAGVLACLALAAPAAGAREQVRVSGTVEARIVPAGEDLVFFRATPRGHGDLVRARPGGGWQRLRRYAPIVRRILTWTTEHVELAASPTRVVAGFGVSGGCSEFTDECLRTEGVLATSRLDGSGHVVLEHCADGVAPVSSAAVSGDVVAYVGAGCGEPDGVAVVDLGAGPASGRIVVPGSRAAREVRIAGRFVAWYEHLGSAFPPEVVVADWRTGRESYRAPAGSEFALRDDGVLVQTVSPATATGCGRVRLAWHSPERPAGEVLPAELCATSSPLDVFGERIAYGRHADPDDPDAVRRAVTDLSGSPSLDAAPRAPRFGLVVDLARERVVYPQRACYGSVIVVDPLGSGEPPPRVECPMGVRWAHAVTAGPTGLATLGRVSCPEGCHGYVLLRRGRRTLGRAPFELRPARRADLRVRLPRAARAAARAERVRVRAEIRAFRAPRPPRSGTFALRAR